MDKIEPNEKTAEINKYIGDIPLEERNLMILICWGIYDNDVPIVKTKPNEIVSTSGITHELIPNPNRNKKKGGIVIKFPL